MRRAILFVAAGLAAAAAAAAQPRPRDIDGWDQVKWGMTLAQVRALYPDAIAAADRYWSRLQLPAIQLGEIPLQVDVSARQPADRITLIALWCYFGLPAGERGRAPNLSTRDFDALKDAMFRKYGSPRDEATSAESGDSTHSYFWIFPSGSITLRLTQNRKTPTLGSFRVEYHAAEKAPI